MYLGQVLIGSVDCLRASLLHRGSLNRGSTVINDENIGAGENNSYEHCPNINRYIFFQFHFTVVRGQTSVINRPYSPSKVQNYVNIMPPWRRKEKCIKGRRTLADFLSADKKSSLVG